MPSELSSDVSSSASDTLLKPSTGVERLLQGKGQLELGDSVASARSFFGREASADTKPMQVPAWVFYLGDLVLMSGVVWMIILNPEPLSLSEHLLCLGLVLMAASIGLWPWLRNVLYCDAMGESRNLPKWAIAEQVTIGGEPRCLVIHLQRPHVAVEVSETSWNGVNTKPYWIDGPPNLPPGGVKSLLDEAASYFQSHRSSAAGPEPAASNEV